MITLQPPTIRAQYVLNQCLVTYRDSDLQRRLAAISNNIELAEAAYSRHGVAATLFLLAEQESIVANDGSVVTAREMVNLYTDKLSKLKQPPRMIYDALKALAKRGVCPLCNHRQVSTLDHYLPKTKYPLYAITPINLLPACMDCNKIKSQEVALVAEKQTLHPYFDNVDDAVWLVARLIEGRPPGVIFSAEPPMHWLDTKRDRVTEHFDAFELAEMYAANSAQELAQIAHALNSIADDYGAAGVKDHLSRQAISRHISMRNAWQTALYVAMVSTEWFWNGGHRQITAS